jgi:hypothetical protein
MDWGKLLDWIKLPPKLLFALAAICGVLVFASESLLEALGLSSIVETLRGWIGFGFVAFSALLLAHFGAWLVGAVKPLVKERLFIRLHRKRLHQLDDAEKKLLAEFIAQNRRTLRCDIKDGTVTVLTREHILAPAAQVGDLIDGMAHAVQPWAWEYLCAHRDLLEPHLTHRSNGRR